ncbi:hypothetical protein [Hoeflea sp.]|uniref:hypothetical protein n=1 Tax=Hoeflea sp. TaxID=1940281 RepID=UPI00198CBC6D|nr:hypothetical protein [Hoeflea sp.]MBC7286136.1 hypothetical protein [Hoeflea sp.]
MQDRKWRMNEVWQWVVAIDAFDFNDPEPLAEIRKSEPIPHELEPIVAAIDAGERKSNKKAAAKLKIPARERMKIAGTLSIVIGLINILKSEEIGDEWGEYRRAIEIGADRRLLEPVDELRALEREARELIQGTADDLGVSVETIENLLRDMRRKIADWPNI